MLDLIRELEVRIRLPPAGSHANHRSLSPSVGAAAVGTALRRFAHKGLKGIVGVGTKSQCAELAGKLPAQAARKGTGSDPRRASRSSMPVPGFRSCAMQKKRFVGPIRLPSYAIPLTVLI